MADGGRAPEGPTDPGGQEVPSVGTMTTAGGVSRRDRRAKFSSPRRRFPVACFRRRRRRLADRLEEGVAVLFGAKGVLDAWEEHRFDPTFRIGAFRQEPNLFYLTGLEAPGAAATIDLSTAEVQVFLPGDREDDVRDEVDRLGLGEPLPLDRFEERVETRVRSRPAYLLFRPPEVPSLRSGFGEESAFPAMLAGGRPGTWPDERLVERFRERFEPSTVRSLLPALVELRRTKDRDEVGALRDAAGATVEGLLAGIAAVAPGVDDREVLAEMEAQIRRAGAQRSAFSPVVQSGRDVLRSFVDVVDSYDRLNRTMEAGELALLDFGAELDYYVADLARTVPVSGRFTEDQRLAYEAYLSAHRAGLEVIGPGASFMEAAEATAEAFEAQLSGLPGWLRDAVSRFADAARGFRPGHFLGLELHDHEEYGAPLQPGEVVAYEHHFRIPDRGWRFTVEDMVLVTAEGRELLSRGLPSDPDGIEEWMAVGGGA